MKNIMKSLSCGALLLLASCGSEGQAPDLTEQLVGTLKTSLQQRKTSAAPQAAAGVTRAQADQSSVPLVRLTIGEQNTQATAAALAQNGDTATYLMATGQAIYLRGGLITGTRGLGYDLMSLDMPYRSINAAVGKGSYQRVHRYLNSEGALYKQAFECSAESVGTRTLNQLDRSYAVRQITETCEGGETRFQNTYDIDQRTGQVWQSRQWVGPTAGYGLIEQLKS